MKGALSPPMRGRGLKQTSASIEPSETKVAPHAGAWIETCPGIPRQHRYSVAPHAGAWIETFYGMLQVHGFPSRPPCGGVD